EEDDNTYRNSMEYNDHYGESEFSMEHDDYYYDYDSNSPYVQRLQNHDLIGQSSNTINQTSVSPNSLVKSHSSTDDIVKHLNLRISPSELSQNHQSLQAINVSPSIHHIQLSSQSMLDKSISPTHHHQHQYSNQLSSQNLPEKIISPSSHSQYQSNNINHQSMQSSHHNTPNYFKHQPQSAVLTSDPSVHPMSHPNHRSPPVLPINSSHPSVHPTSHPNPRSSPVPPINTSDPSLHPTSHPNHRSPPVPPINTIFPNIYNGPRFAVLSTPDQDLVTTDL
ncbi:unnamed protein product, partial [Meganyctiphanes norvegica]